MASVADVLAARDVAASSAEPELVSLVGPLEPPPAPPKPKRSVADVLLARETPPEAPIRTTPTTTVPRQFIAGMVQRGWTPAEAAAAAGNIHAESGFDPGIQERQPLAGRGGFGLLQWTGPRRRALESFAASTGRAVDDLETQMDFLHAERTGQSTRYGGPDERTSYRKAFPEGGGPSELAYRFGAHVERPANLEASASKRTAAARQFAGDRGAERIGYPSAAPTPKRSVADVLIARETPHTLRSGEAAGAGLGGAFRTEAERAQVPEFLRRPEEEAAPAAPQPFEPPPLLKRPAYEEAPPGAYGKPTRLEEAALTGVRIGVPMAAGITAGALTGPGAPVTVPLMSAAAGTAAELGAEEYERRRGLRREISPGQVAFQGALSAIPGVKLPATLGPVVRTGVRAGEGVVMGTGGTAGSTFIEEGRLPTAEELAWGGGLGAVLGTAGGAVEAKGIPYLRERAPGFVGPRETPSSWQLHATEKARTSAEQLAGETTAPPVGAEPGPRMVTRPGEIIEGGPVAVEPRAVPPEAAEFIGPPAPTPEEAVPVGRSTTPFIGPPEPPPAPGELPPPPGIEAPGAGRPWEAPPEELGPYGQAPTFRRYPGLGEALTGEEIGPQLGADPERMTRAIESIDREFGDVFDEPTRDRLKQQIRDNQARFEYLGRGKQTVERTQGLARDLLFDLDKAKLEPQGTTWNPEKTQAAKNHIVSLDQSIVAAQEAFDADPTPQNGLILQKAAQDQVDAFNIYRARGAEAGRTVNIYKASAEDIASGNQGLMMAALRRGVRPDQLADIIKSTGPKDITTRAEMLMAVSERGPWHKRLRDNLQTIWISNILSGPPPHMRNVLGNSINALLSPVVKGAAAFHERFLARVPDAERTVRLGEVGKHFVGLYDGMPDAIYKAAEVLTRGYTQQQAATYDLPRRELGIGRHPALRMALNIVPRGLGSMDMFFRVLGQEASLNGQAYTKARNQALVEQAGRKLPAGVSFADRLDQLYSHHRANLTPDMMDQAADEAARGVYQERDKIARTVQFIRDQIPGGGFLAPFVTTSTNLAKQGLHWTPAGYLMASTRGKGVTPRMATIHKGEALAGTAGMLLAPLALWAAGGKLHGSGPDDPDEFNVWRRTHVPNSIEIGGVQVGFQQLGPLAIPLGIIGNAWDRYEAIEKQQGFVSPQDADDIAIAAIGGAAESVLDQPYMQGISNLVDVIRHPKEGRYWSKLFKDIGTGFVPGAGMLRWAEQIEDPTIREAKTLPEKMQAMIPGGVSAGLPPKLDEFGRPIEIEKVGGPWGRALLPIDVETVRHDPLREELAKFGMTLSAPGAGTPEKGEPPYTEREGLVIRQAKGQQVRAELEDLIASDAYQEADPEDQLTMLKSVLGQTRGAIGKAARGLREEGLDVESLRWGE
jgi:hypothetical protein